MKEQAINMITTLDGFLSNIKNIDLLVDTENLTIEKVANIIYNKYKELFIK